ncbi:GNAT family N-acetyltransferase [Candidatus Agathobaculum pullicola]|uniref:GNAT family N-acetyltransferase n=1 Tax=Candidatus Agathobaculum pullicola TaxID=2838426 RepID=UPI003F8FDC26
MEFQHYEMESKRLRFRRLRANDFSLVAPLLQDKQTMYAWEHGFSYEEVIDWIADMLRRYREDQCGYFAGIDRETGALVALAGPLVERLDADTTALGLGYIVRRDLWRQGYGVECARTALTFAFEKLGASRVLALIRPDNIASLHVAAACGMKPVGRFTRAYRGKKLPHVICAVEPAAFFATLNAEADQTDDMEEAVP